jgi:hypothetical protein
MPIEPPKTLFDPDLAKASLRPVLEIALPLLREVLGYGLALFARCSIRPEGDDENLVILLTYRHFLEMLDSINIQLAESAPSPAALQLRAMFEALLTVKYITQDRTKTRSRALAYLFLVERSRKHFYLTQQVGTKEYETFLQAIATDPYSKQWIPVNAFDLAGRIQEIDELLTRPDFAEIAQEYDKTRKASGRKPHWYSLYDGPRNIQQLAAFLGCAAWYQLLYKELSERGHSTDVIDRILTHDTNGPAARALRDPSEFNWALDFAISFALDASRIIIRYYRPDEEPGFDRWVKSEVMPSWKRIPKIEVRGHQD